MKSAMAHHSPKNTHRLDGLHGKVGFVSIATTNVVIAKVRFSQKDKADLTVRHGGAKLPLIHVA